MECNFEKSAIASIHVHTVQLRIIKFCSTSTYGVRGSGTVKFIIRQSLRMNFFVFTFFKFVLFFSLTLFSDFFYPFFDSYPGGELDSFISDFTIAVTPGAYVCSFFRWF